MRISVGIDVAKDVHWAAAVDESATALWDGPLDNTPEGLEAFVDTLHSLPGEIVIGVDVLGSIAAFLQASLLAAGFVLVYVPGIAVNRARQATIGGEKKSDRRDARVIAEQVRVRRDLREVRLDDDLTVAIRLLVGRRRDLIEEQNRRLSRLHYLLAGVHPGLERQLDLTSESDLWLLTRYVSPYEIREAGCEQIAAYLRSGSQIWRSEVLAECALVSARAQRISIPGEKAAADLLRELAAEALACRARVISIDRELADLVHAHRDGHLVRSLPGMGVVLTASLIAAMGSSSASGRLMRSPRRPAWRRCCGNRANPATAGSLEAVTRS
ncbi:IS110 family transposase [Inquilinus limosus]|uniref:IS110 family transposase n=1 Tax=Inquilinus limosus TaxID=171674 RepID=UPI003F177867